MEDWLDGDMVFEEVGSVFSFPSFLFLFSFLFLSPSAGSGVGLPSPVPGPAFRIRDIW